MSSDIFSRKIDFNSFGLIYASAQKNMGPAGVTMVIIRDNIIGKINRHIPTMLDYNTHINKKSAFSLINSLSCPKCLLTVKLFFLNWLFI